MRQQAPPEGWLSEAELIAESGISRRNLIRWRGQGLVPKPNVMRLGAAGTASYYPPIAVPMILRLYELQRETRDVDAWIWGLWLDDRDFPADIRAWTIAKLRSAQQVENQIKDFDDLECAVLAMPKPGRNNPLRPMYGRVRTPSNRATLMIWGIALGLGLTPPSSLYDRSQPVFRTLKKAVGLPKNERVPDRELRVERMSLARLCEIITAASTMELEQVRQDCRTIARLASTAEAVDWGAVDATLSRHTRRKLKAQRISPPAAVGTLLDQWRNFTCRAGLLPFLISVRRSPDHSVIMSQRLAISERAVAAFPKLPVHAASEQAQAGLMR
jgi:hypothetical protein